MSDDIKTLAQVEQEHIEAVMILCENRPQWACRALGIGRTTLYKKLAKYAEQRKALDSKKAPSYITGASSPT